MRTFTLSFFLLLAALSVSTLNAVLPVTIQIGSGSRVDVYGRVEFTARASSTGIANPFTDVKFTGEITAPSGKVSRVNGFCDSDDGSLFRLRFMPSEPGKHSWVLRWTHSSEQKEERGNFTARNAKLPGPVRIDSKHPYHFIIEGPNTNWFWNGTTTYHLLAWDDQTITNSIARLASLGVNRIRVALTGRTKNGSRWNEPMVLPTEKFKFRTEPWIARNPENFENPQYDVTRFNIDTYRKAERMLEFARKHGVVVSLIFYVDGRDKGVDPFGKDNMGGEMEKLYYRYTVARFASFPNLMWDITNEYRLFRDDPWAEAMGAFLKECDPYDHITSIHGHGDFKFRKSPWADFAMYQSWDDAGGYKYMLKNRREQEATGRPMPQVNEEYGYEDHYPTGWGGAKVWPARSGDNRRRLAWGITMAGCYQTTGERANDGTGAGPDTGGGWINGRGSADMTMLLGYRHMVKFFTAFPWWEMQPAEELAGDGTVVLSKPGQRYVAYMAAGGKARVKLPAGTYKARWYDPRRGHWSAPFQVQQNSESMWESPAPADAGDWALLIEK